MQPRTMPAIFCLVLCLCFWFCHPGFAAQEERQPRLHNDMPSPKLALFKQTVEHQAQQHPDAFFLQSVQPEKTVALTFDDGPDPVCTRQVLAILRQHHVKATFFMMGEKMERCPDVVREIVKDGNAVGGHTFDHPDLRKLTLDQAQDEVMKTQAQFQAIVGFQPDFFRPPYGAVTDLEIERFAGQGFKMIDWSIDSFDWDVKHNSVPEILEKIARYRHPGAIVLMHAAGKGHHNTVAALPTIIESLVKDGYRLVTVPELLHIQAVFTEPQPRASN